MRAIIVDDEPLARRGIVQLLAGHADIEVIAECANGVEAMAAIRASSPDLVFLDVQMPEMDGFDVVRRIGVESMPSVVFITAHDEFAVQAFEASAVDYLMKPVGPDRFAAAMKRVRIRRSEKTALRRVVELQTLLSHVEPAPDPIIVTTTKGAVRIDPAEIDWIGADDYYAVIHVGEKHYLLRESLTSLEERLPANMFVRVHRSAIVNCRSVREMRRGALIMRDGTRIITSRRKRTAVTSALRGAKLVLATTCVLYPFVARAQTRSCGEIRQVSTHSAATCHPFRHTAIVHGLNTFTGLRIPFTASPEPFGEAIRPPRP